MKIVGGQSPYPLSSNQYLKCTDVSNISSTSDKKEYEHIFLVFKCCFLSQGFAGKIQ